MRLKIYEVAKPFPKFNRKTKPFRKRFMERVSVDLTTGCWNWTAGKDKDGYGSFRFYYPNGTVGQKAHRYAYIQEYGDVPEGMELDHKCRNRACVRPDHLEAVTHLTNVKRGDKLRLKTHCKNGHPLEGAHLSVVPSQTKNRNTPMRRCRTCATMRQRRYREKDKNVNP